MAASADSPDNPTLTRDWLARLYGDAPGWLTLFALDRTSGEQHVRWQPAPDLDLLARDAHELAGRCCVWFGAATRTHRTGGRGGAKDCRAIPGLWVDIDVAGPNHNTADLPDSLADAHTLLAAYPLEPTVVVNTGGGLQAWWLFHEMMEATDGAAELLQRWGYTWAEHGRAHGWHVDNVFDLSRVMRLPGTINHKTAPAPVTIEHADWGRRFNPDDLEQYTSEPPEPPAPQTLERIPYIGPERPGDAFNAARTGRDVLDLIGGFTYVKTDGDGDHYHYDGAKSPTSATVYADGHTTIWSETFASKRPAVEVKRPYDPFGLYCAALHGGDWRAARIALADAGYGARNMELDDFTWIEQQQRKPADQPALEQRPHRLVDRLIRWPEFWQTDHALEEWVARPLIPGGRQVALYAPAKTGKSILTLAVVAAVATGRRCLGGDASPPQHVLYLDYEMTEADLRERLEALGYGPDDDLSHLHYWSLPSSIDALNTVMGCDDLVELAAEVDAAVVVIDTMGRAITGDENDATPYREFAARTGLKLKAAGRAVLRTDHAGKDLEKGQRGTSAKNDDVDVVFRLTAIEQGYILERTHSRIAWVPERSVVHREEDADGIVNFIVKGNERVYATGTADLAATLDELGVPHDASRRKVGEMLREAGVKVSSKRINDAIVWRREELNRANGEWYENPRTATRTTPADSRSPLVRTAETDETENRRSEGTGTTPRTTQNHQNQTAQQVASTPVLCKRTGGATPDRDHPPGWLINGDPTNDPPGGDAA